MELFKYEDDENYNETHKKNYGDYIDYDDYKTKKTIIAIPELLFEHQNHVNEQDTPNVPKHPKWLRKRNPRIICQKSSFNNLFDRYPKKIQNENKQEISINTYEQICNDKIKQYKEKIEQKTRELVFYKKLKNTIVELHNEEQKIINEINEIKQEIENIL